MTRQSLDDEPDEPDEAAGVAAGGALAVDALDDPLSELDEDVSEPDVLDELDFFEARLSVL